MTKNDIAADNFFPVMELQAANGCSDASVLLTLGLPLYPLGQSTFG